MDLVRGALGAAWQLLQPVAAKCSGRRRWQFAHFQGTKGKQITETLSMGNLSAQNRVIRGDAIGAWCDQGAISGNAALI